MDVLEPSRYVFDKYKLLIPSYFSLYVPDDVQARVHTARKKAETAFQALKQIERRYRERFHRLCPPNDITRFRKHINSITRLLEWKESHGRDTTLSTSPKIPRCVLNFYIEEKAYLRYVAEYEKMMFNYLNGPYREWREIKRELDEMLSQSGMADMEKSLSFEWWTNFQSEMWTWEVKVDQLVLPKWDKIVEELSGIIQDRVDMTGEWESWA